MSTVTSQRGVHPHLLMMWIYLVSMTMMFAGLTSALIVGRADHLDNASWRNFDLPTAFHFTTVIALLSSITMQAAYVSAKRNRFAALRMFLWITTALGFVFLIGQWMGFRQLYAAGVYFVDNAQTLGTRFRVNNVSGSFLFVITGLHALHLVAALIASLVMMVRAIGYKITAEKTTGLKITAVFWHALGILWLYLYLFFSTIYQT
ncbi:MAG: cytochrome c oxidase subunit 3 [Bacteroidia bacterium]|nr:cytochrome c oxidase subunit 3 [Bacteroidia bacterium]MDW8334019.1 cytochrome c oxidase subunit 3 [Bacteroidia bacterium]